MLLWRKREVKMVLMTQFLKGLSAAKRFWEYKRCSTPRGVGIEITGTCNAKCYYCQVGYDNLNHVRHGKKAYLSVDEFQGIIRFLKERGFLTKGDRLMLNVWNEPCLHPEFSEIIKVGHKEGCLMSLNTNGSIRPKLFDDFNAVSIGNVGFSMPGFSQASYNRIHQFDFEQIKSNIEWMVKTFRQRGCFGFFLIRFHIYRFNVDEIEPARKWAQSLGICFQPYYAYINDSFRMQQYLCGKLSDEYAVNVSRDLFMDQHCSYVLRKKTRTCDMMRHVFIDTDGFVMYCCLNSTRMGHLTDFRSHDQLLKAHRDSEICRKCLTTLGPHIMEASPLEGNKLWKQRIACSYLFQALKTCFL